MILFHMALKLKNLLKSLKTVRVKRCCVLWVALSAEDKSAFLVTGNGKHFPSKLFIVTPAELINMFDEIE